MEKLKTLVWFLRRPSHWNHAAALIQRKFGTNLDAPHLRAGAREWAAQRAVGVTEALAAVGLTPATGNEAPRLPESLIAEATERAALSKRKMGGPGDIDLLYAATLLSGARKVVETGVAYGWSSLSVLAALDGRKNAQLVSVDMPYPKMNNEEFVGIVVPETLRAPWQIVREPDRNGLRKAINLIGGAIDLSHYDSDKSFPGRKFGYEVLWGALRTGGIFISDDIQDNFGFKEFVERKQVKFAVTESAGKFVGIARKA